MGRASRASSMAGPDHSYYLTKRTELGQLIMHAYKEPEIRENNKQQGRAYNQSRGQGIREISSKREFASP